MRFLEHLLRQACSHRFSWPRIDPFGRHYQICLHCGAAYGYDWDGMRQTGRLQPMPNVAAEANASRTAPGWSW